MRNGPVELVQFLQLFDRIGDGWAGVVLVGVFAGFLVRFSTSSERSIGFWSTCLFGVAGALLGVGAAAWLGLALHGAGPRFLAALVGSFALALAAGMLRRRKAPGP